MGIVGIWQVCECRAKKPRSKSGAFELPTSHRPLAAVLSTCLPSTAAVSAAGMRSFLLFRNSATRASVVSINDGDRAGILQGCAHDLGRIEHAGLDQVFVLAGQGVVAEVVVLRVVDLAQDDCAFFAGVLGDLAQRLFQGALHDVDADLLVAFELQLVESG